MKQFIQLFLSFILLFTITACNNSSPFQRLSKNKLDQKSYATGYGSAAQTYKDRVNETYDIDSFIRGVDHLYSNKITQSIQQVRENTLNKMLDHNIYAYYSGILFAASLKQNFNYLNDQCWNLIEPKSITQGIYDAMYDLKNNKVKHNNYISQGYDEILHLCVKKVEEAR
ncbi:hypothetical protein [Phocoenobacter skyensis]|uniref:Domain amino terminal to FKBP-type peptidyl-prolyl isomerase n=1 Tax=Phocoenobacter skyensis TaxID=97481 RepID=A0A1H7V4C6_9PAST|nr:hypothetical protein [Pasteurella skyensis]MDP8078455.1 hypothetical protein [Pasteurella skyensis]MDP8084453.1 hypothetical protein [Pasteurella skyensis]MDP8161816.1 hypothetical protein [Pasteurella skyensis]MDP8170441.1 hypothetical protein [Pasteurella skyensis]MDP8171972.1 hypothetical protein [Pasteurella skyensis]